jgi:hypothetical protein
LPEKQKKNKSVLASDSTPNGVGSPGVSSLAEPISFQVAHLRFINRRRPERKIRQEKSGWIIAEIVLSLPSNSPNRLRSAEKSGWIIAEIVH